MVRNKTREKDRDFQKILGQYMKAARLAHGYTQESVAKVLGIHRGTVSRLENGKGLVTARQFLLLLDLLRFDLGALMAVEKEREILKYGKFAKKSEEILGGEP